MINKYVAMGLGALIALAPMAIVPAAAQATDTTAAAPAKAHSGSHRSQMRHRNNMSKHHTRTTAHHRHKQRHHAKPAAAPKS